MLRHITHVHSDHPVVTLNWELRIVHTTEAGAGTNKKLFYGSVYLHKGAVTDVVLISVQWFNLFSPQISDSGTITLQTLQQDPFIPALRGGMEGTPEAEAHLSQGHKQDTEVSWVCVHFKLGFSLSAFHSACLCCGRASGEIVKVKGLNPLPAVSLQQRASVYTGQCSSECGVPVNWKSFHVCILQT